MELGPVNFYFIFGFHLIKLIINASINKNKLIQVQYTKPEKKKTSPKENSGCEITKSYFLSLNRMKFSGHRPHLLSWAPILCK